MPASVADLDSYVCSFKEGPFLASRSDNACQSFALR